MISDHKAEYLDVLQRLFGDSYVTLERLRSRKGSKFAPKPGSDPGFTIYGVLRLVTADKSSPFCASMKEITINDPTYEYGISFTVKGKTELLIPGNIVKLSSVQTVPALRSNEAPYTVEARNVTQYQTFTYDYNQHTNFDESDFIAHPFVDSENDEAISEVLEKWISSDILERKFSQLQQVPGKSYIDFVAQIIEQRMMRGSLVLTLWDGTDPGTSTDDPYKPEFSHTYTQYGNNYMIRTNNNVKEFVPINKFVYVNVWKNYSNMGNEHFERAAHFSLKDGDDMLVMFNVEVSPNRLGQAYPIQLNMRSGHHQGKGIRLVKRHSILGKAFAAVLQQEMEKFTILGDISDGDIPDEEMETVQVLSDTLFENQTSKDFQAIKSERASTPTSPERKKPKTIFSPSVARTPNRQAIVTPNKATVPAAPSIATVPPAPSIATVPPASVASTSTGDVQRTPIKQTVITIDLDDPDIKTLLCKLPPHISFSTLVSMDTDELNEYETLLTDVDDWVESDIREFGENLTKDCLLEILQLARRVKECNSDERGE